MSKIKELENDLLKNSEILGDIYKNAPILMLLVDAEGKVKSINYYVEEFTGKSKENILGYLGGEVLQCIESFNGAGCGRNKNCPQCPIRTRVEQTFRTGNLIYNDEIKMTFVQNGSPKTFDLLISTILISSQKSQNNTVLLALNDVTKLRTNEHNLLKSEQHYRNLLEGATDLIGLIDESGIILYYSPSIRNVLGYDIEECIGEPIYSYLHKDDKKKLIISITKALEKVINKHGSGNKYNISVKRANYRLRHKKGGYKIFNVGIRIHSPDGTLSGTMFIVNAADITEIVTIQQKLLIEKNKADESNRSKTTFLANMSHELRTPLNAILGFSQLLQQTESINNNEIVSNYINMIYSTGNHLLEMLNDILDLSKIEAGKIEVVNKEVNLNNFMTHFPETIQLMAKEKEVNFIVNVPEDNGVIKTDEVRLKQILYNFLSNAIKFTDSGKNVTFSIVPEENFIKFIIADEGIGIPKNEIKRIFRKFEQIRNDNAVKNQGTGLGLAITKKIVHALRGKIYVKSRPGKGSVFTVVLHGWRPSKEKKSKNHATHYLENEIENLKKQFIIQRATKECSILIVDDILVNQKLLEGMLKKVKCKVISSDGGLDVIKKVENNKINLVLMDIEMPQMSGVELLKILKKDHPTLPIIAVSAHAMKEQISEYIDLGFDDYIIKPVKYDQLLQKIIMHCPNGG